MVELIIRKIDPPAVTSFEGHMNLKSVLLVAPLTVVLAASLAAAAAPIREGEVRFEPGATEQTAVPEQFRLEPHTFPFREESLSEVSKAFSRSNVTFPSPVTTPHEVNNTVHCEYYRPTSAGKHPACVVLHILGGDFELSRLFCNALAQRGVAALFVKMPYYGPRRPQNVRMRMISPDPNATVAGMTQAVLDIRRGVAWLGAQDEVDPQQIGVFGISLGGITGALACAAEPRFQKACLLLAGGDIGLVSEQVWNSPHLADVRSKWESAGGTRDSLMQLMKTIDPFTYAANCRDRKILMLNARNDEIIPPKCTESLWQAFGRPEIVWYNAGHITAGLYILDAISKVTEFFQPSTRS